MPTACPQKSPRDLYGLGIAFLRAFILGIAIAACLIITIALQFYNLRQITRLQEHHDALANRIGALEGDMAALEQLVRDATGLKVEPKGERP